MEDRGFLNSYATGKYSDKPDGYYAGDRAEMLEFIPSTAQTILEIGCGEGAFSHKVRQRTGATVWGVEPDPASADLATGRLDRVLNETVEAAFESLTGAEFDVIVFNDVLEHLDDPKWTLQMCRSHLTQEGSVVASIPNIRYWRVLKNLVVDHEFTYTTHGILDETHRWFFTDKTIVDLFRSCGYRIIRMKGINRTGSRTMRALDRLSFGRIHDTLYRQIAIVATLQSGAIVSRKDKPGTGKEGSA